MAVKPAQRKHVKSATLPGITYVVTKNGTPQAVIIDLKRYGSLWEDFQDLLVAKKRRNEPRVSWDEAKKGLRKQGKMK